MISLRICEWHTCGTYPTSHEVIPLRCTVRPIRVKLRIAVSRVAVNNQGESCHRQILVARDILAIENSCIARRSRYNRTLKEVKTGGWRRNS